MKRKCRSPTEAETENLIYTDKKRRGKNMELKNRKKKEQLPSSEKNMAGLKKRVVLLTGMGVLAVCLVTAGLVKGCGSKTTSAPSMQEVFEQYLDEKGNAFDALDSLSKADQEKVISAAIEELNKLIGDGSAGYDKNAVISRLEQVLADLDLGLSTETIHTIAEKMVKLYTNNFNSVYSDVEKTNNTVKQLGDTVTKQLQENLYSMTEYLTQLDTQITTNQSTLEQISGSTKEMENSVLQLNEKTDRLSRELTNRLTEVKSSFEKVNSFLTDQETKLDAYYEQYGKDQETLHSEMKEIQNGITETKNQIIYTEQKLTESVNALESKNQLRQKEVTKSLEAVKTEIEKTQKQMETLEGNVAKDLAAMESELKDTMAVNQKENKSIANANQAELKNILSELESGLKDQADQNLTQIVNQFSGLEALTKQNFAELNENLDLSVADLKNQMDNLHEQISKTQGEITEILTAMDKKQDIQYQETLDAVQRAAADISSQLNKSYEDLEKLILQLSKDNKTDHAETLQKLEEMKSGLNSSINANLNQITVSFGNLNTALDNYFKQLQESQGASQDQIGDAIGNLGSDVKKNQQVILDSLTTHDAANKEGQQAIKDAIAQHNTNVMAEQERLANAITGNQSNVQEYLEQLKNALNEKLDAVFTRVSNGKKGLASALLTKGVSVSEDATFAEIREAILNVPQKIVIGVDQVPGEIEYDYHYHTDATGNRVGEVAHQDTQGGCYTKPVYHTHTDSCYQMTHEHNEHCKGHPVWVDWAGVEPYWGYIYDCGDYPLNKRGDLVCTLPTSTDSPIYYELGCGLADGQIVGARIVYNNAAEMDTTALTLEPQLDKSLIRRSEKSDLPVRMEDVKMDTETVKSELGKESETETEETEVSRTESKEKEETADETVSEGSASATEPEQTSEKEAETDMEQTTTKESGETDKSGKE